MANVWLCSPEYMRTGDTTDLNVEFNALRQTGFTVETTSPRYGTKHFGGVSAVNIAERTVSPTLSEFYFGMACYFNATGQPAFEVREGTIIHLGVVLNAAGNLELQRGTTVIATGTQVLSLNTWYFIELHGLIADSGGVGQVRVSQPAAGVNDINFSGDTRNAGTSGVFDKLRLAVPHQVKRTDIYLNDITGSVNNSWMGDMTIAALFPSGAGNSTDLTPSAGSNFQNVSQTATDEDTTYNSSATAGQKDLYALGDLPASATAVTAVRTIARVRKDDAGARNGRLVVRTSSTDYEGSDIALGDTYTHVTKYDNVNPNTGSSWTVAQVNALQAGVKVQT